MMTKNIIRMPWPVMMTFQVCPFAMYWTPGCISSRRMYIDNAMAMVPITADVIR